MKITLNYRKIISSITKFWLRLNLTVRLMALATLTVSLSMSSLTFWALTVVQKDSTVTDNRFCRDLGALFSANVIDLIYMNDQKGLVSFLEKVYLRTSSIKYIFVFYSNGNFFFGLPSYIYSTQSDSFISLYKNLPFLTMQDILFDAPLVKYNYLFKDQIIDIIVPLTKNGQKLGFLNIGINSNSSISSSFKLIRYISIAIFISIWFMVIIGATFNALTMIEPINEILLGIKNITSGNFSQRINRLFVGELGNLIVNFNEMAEKLESYEKQNIDKLTSEKNKLETIVSTIADGAILLDTDLRVIFINRIALKSLGCTNLDLVGKPLTSYLPIHVNESLLPLISDLQKVNNIKCTSSLTKELCIHFDYNYEKIFRFLLTSVLDKSSNLFTSIAIIIQDISREVQLNKAKNQFIGNVSHELRTPLCNIGAFLETLIDYNHSLTDKQKAQFLTIANNETKRLSILVNDILDLSRLESSYTMIFKFVYLPSLLNNIIKTFQLAVSNNNLDLILELDPYVNFVWAHEASLFQVLFNLIGNSIKFTVSDGSIVIRVFRVLTNDILQHNHNVSVVYSSIDLIRIEVIDEGIGISKSDQKQVFERFVRIEDTIHTLQGTGLGLSIVKNILLKYSTRIMIYSEIYVGTSFWFDLWILK
uniref:Uncharacterized sensor-like histidine kinase ycf26 n=2 Tax=Gelidium TaxID=2811 RepID=A0A411FSV9_9FLOR|nr:hypothetical protein [Gelidium coulteri]YP_009565276.1 hypothetical protein [Gelidium sinicola]QBA96227.1 hypothetical protein [Gelidium coulteri]QBA96627.1 hypothetical protein [Gelidium sinicola]